MAGLGGLISNIISHGTELLPAIQDSLFTPWSSSSSSSSDNESKLREIEKDLKRLMRMLKRIQATLRDAERREIRDEAVRLWLTELREVAYAADDVLDEWNYEQIKAQVEARNASQGNPNKRKLIQIPEGLADQIKEIRCTFDEICEDHKNLKLHEDDGVRITEAPSLPIPSSHLCDESKIFGRENAKKIIINLLLSDCDKSNITVVPIVGMGGLGKTTVAQLVYDDKGFRQQFDHLGWIWVSNDFDVKRLTKSILESVVGYASNLSELSLLQRELKIKLADKSVLLVLDDVWNDQHDRWESLMTPFSLAKRASILVTTRNQSVALVAQTVPFVKLGTLPFEHCWQIFQHYSLIDFSSIEHSDLMELGRKITNKCSGLPLAVKSMAALLRHENEEKWEEVLESEIWEALPKNEAFAALRISYMRLPEHLKSCLLFCSMFPKGYLHKADVLINRWIAHDFILSRRKMSMEEVGMEYVTELRQRSFLDLNRNLYRTLPNTYKIHDIVHDMLCMISRGADHEINTITKDESCYHLFVDGHSDLIGRHSLSHQLVKLRTLILWCQEGPTGQLDDDCNLSNAPRLRALEIYNGRENFSPYPVGQMKHLRHLVLDYYDRDLEPIEQLFNLRFLSLTHCKLNELPKEFGNLANLKSLYLSYCGIKSLPKSFIMLSNLEKLNIEHCNLEILPENLGNLTSLKELKINGCPLEAFPDSLCDLGNLKSLRLTVDDTRPFKLPEAIGNLSSLKKLFIDAHINDLPPSFNEIYNCCRSTRLFKVVVGKNDGLGWVKHFGNLKGALCFECLRNLDNLHKVRQEILVAMHYLEALVLGWSRVYLSRIFGPTLEREDILYVSVKPQTTDPMWVLQMMPSEGMSLSILERLRPHRNLKWLDLSDYPGNMLPSWMEDPFVCASLETINMHDCDYLSSLPFGNLCALRNLGLWGCKRLLSLHEDSLPAQLEKLEIEACPNLKFMPIVFKLISLVELRISYCKNLTSFKKESDGDEANWLPPASCSVVIQNCPSLKDWCVQQCIVYTSRRAHPMCGQIFI